MKKIICSAALGLAVLPFAAGTALADEAQTWENPTKSAPEQDTQSPLQGLSAGAATTDQLMAQFLDAANGPGPSGADGVETEIPQPDPRFVEGPAGGLLAGPFD
jgi:hypothetical protein